MKKGIVMCEGTDDTHFLGYFLYKNSTIVYEHFKPILDVIDIA